MGVKGLWRLLLPVGRRISIETLEGQILAIDASIWLTQFLTVAARQRELDLLGDDVHGNKDGNGDGINNTTTHGKAYSYDYLVGFLRRLCKLRYQGVRPVLVFDGETPEIKKREIRARNRRRKRKLGESFYLGGNSNNNGNGGDGDGDKKNNTEEDEEMLEATRRMAKRILAKQLRTGKLVTTKNKHKKLKTTNDAKPNLNVAIASAAYAPGFYDPDAAVVVAPQAQAEQGNGASHATDKNDGDDDDNHLLRDDYQTNPLQEEINDWDRPIVVDSNDENNSNTNNNNTNPSEKKDRKNGSSRRFAEASNHHHFNFHAGDGTKFRVQSVADLPESTRKDVIEDARKQRRLASRREFMKVASDPDGLSSCQLRNFLKSTKLNRDIVTMAQAAKHKAEEEAKIVKGNGILFEKDVDESIYKNKNSINTARSCRQHYRSGAARNKAKKSNSGMMRMFHHKDQPQKGNAVGNDDIDEDDEHDFRKARNNHYLSGGLRFVNTGDDAEDKDDEDVKEDDSTNLKSNTLPTITSEDDGGGFVLAVMDGSDKPSRNKTTIEKTSMNSGGVACQIIEIDIISSSESESENESDGNDSEANRKPRATKPKNESTKAAQELRDESLARALQSIEEEECIEIDDSDEDSGSDGGFLENSTALKERGIGVPQIQQERDDARLARTLQNAEYGEEEDQSGSGGFLAEANENNIDDEENMGDGGGFLVPTKENTTDKEANSDVGVEFLVPTDTDIMNDKEEHSGGDGGFLIPAKNDMFNTLQSQSQSPTISSHECIGSENDAKMGSKEAPFPRKEWNPFLLNSIGANNTSNSLFDLSKQQKVKKSDINLFVCRESSEDEEEEDIDWEDGNDKNDSSIHCKEDSKKESNTPGAIDKKEYMSPERNKLSDLLQNDLKNAAHTENLDDNADEDNRREVNREDGDCKPRQPNEACNLEAPVLQKKSETTTVHTQDTDENNGDQDDDDEVDWEDGVEEANDIKPVVIDISTVKNGT
jgi:DNA excision repair protein ERCC-5